MKIYTKSGDQGQTGLIGGNRVSKDDLRIETFGTLDELNCFVGWARLAGRDWPLDIFLGRIQNVLFELGSEIASQPESKQSVVAELGTIVEDMERSIDIQTTLLPELKRFVIPGGSELAARLHICRTIARRAERSVVKLSRQQIVRTEIIV